jgi:hypothetical protein
MLVLRRLNRVAFVSPAINGFTVVFDQEVDEQNFDRVEEFGCALTRDLACSGLAAVLHDDDVLYLWLFQNGQAIDQYDSSPGYFDPNAEPSGPDGGDSGLLCRAFERPDRQSRIEQLLRANLLEDELPDIPGELERHQALALELGMPAFAVGLGYSGIAEDYVPAEFQDVVFEPV